MAKQKIEKVNSFDFVRYPLVDDIISQLKIVDFLKETKQVTGKAVETIKALIINSFLFRTRFCRLLKDSNFLSTKTVDYEKIKLCYRG